MPQMDFEEQMEISKIYSVAGLLSKELPFVKKRPFRDPHHTVTQPALLGGGRYPTRRSQSGKRRRTFFG